MTKWCDAMVIIKLHQRTSQNINEYIYLKLLNIFPQFNMKAIWKLECTPFCKGIFSSFYTIEICM